MRRVIASAVLAAAMLVATGCGDSTDSATGTGTTTAAADNTKEVCASAEKALAEGLEDLQKSVTAVLTAAATDNEPSVASAILGIKDALKGWAEILRTEAANATNPELKAAMTTFANEIDKQVAGINTAEDVKNFADRPATSEMNDAEAVLERLCPSGDSSPTPGVSS